MDGRQTTQPDQLIDAGDVDTETRRYLFHFEERLVGWLARRGSRQSCEGSQGRGHLEKSLPSLRGCVHGCLSQVLDEPCQVERLGLLRRRGRHRLGGRCHAGAAAISERRGITAVAMTSRDGAGMTWTAVTKVFIRHRLPRLPAVRSILITIGAERAPITVPARARRVAGSQLRAGSTRATSRRQLTGEGGVVGPTQSPALRCRIKRRGEAPAGSPPTGVDVGVVFHGRDRLRVAGVPGRVGSAQEGPPAAFCSGPPWPSG
jgi:hypothetical protein